VGVAAAIAVAAIFLVPNVLRGFERREMDLYRRDARRVLMLAGEAKPGAPATGLPESFPDGPRGTEAVRDAVRSALAQAREGNPEARTALRRAYAVLDDWSRSLYCSHGLLPLK